MTHKENFYVYILAHKPHGRLYIGVTSDLIRRVYEHKSKIIDGFTKRYNIDMLVYLRPKTTGVSRWM